MACLMHVPLAFLFFFCIVYCQSVIDNSDQVNNVTDIKLKDKTPPLDEDAGIAHLLVTEDLSNIARNDSNDVENTTVTSDDLFRRRRKRRKHGRKRRRHGRKRRRHGRNRHKNSRRRHGRQSKRHSSSKHRDRKRSRRHGQSHHGSDFFHHGSDFFHHASHHDDYHGSSHFTTTEALPTSTGKHSYRFGTKSTMALPDSAVTSGPAIMMKSPLVENEYYKMNDVNAINVNNEIPALEKYVDNTHLIEKRDLSDIAKNDFNDVENTNVESDDLFRHHHSRHHRSNHGRHRHHSSRRRHGHRSHRRHSSHRHGRQQRHHHGSRRHRSPPC